MKNLKKFTALALTAAITLSMAACGSKDAASNGSSEPAASGTSETSASGDSSAVSSDSEEGITSIEDLADLKIGVQTGTTGDSQATEASERGFPDEPFQYRSRCRTGSEEWKGGLRGY